MKDWKYIPGHEGYMITPCGNLCYSEKRGRVAKGCIVQGYRHYWINSNGKQRPISAHRLVALTYIPNPDNKPDVNHKDGNKQNNHYTNLEWVTAKENTAHAIKHGLVPKRSKRVSKEVEAQILREYKPRRTTQSFLADKHGITLQTVNNILKRHKARPTAADPETGWSEWYFGQPEWSKRLGMSTEFFDVTELKETA